MVGSKAERRNSLEKTTAKAVDLKKAMETLPRSEVVNKHPEMKAVYETTDYVRDYVQDQIQDKKQHEPMVKAAVDSLIRQVASGKELPKVKEAVKAPEKEKEEELERWLGLSVTLSSPVYRVERFVGRSRYRGGKTPRRNNNKVF